MNPEAFALLLTVARVLRAKVRDEIYAEQEGDLEALNEALAPFDPVPGAAIDQCSGPAGDHGQVGWMGGEFDR